jgi:hypothetical protein
MINSIEYKRNEMGAVVAEDLDEYEKFKLQRENVLKRKNLEQKVETLEKKVNELTKLVTEINNRLN